VPGRKDPEYRPFRAWLMLIMLALFVVIKFAPTGRFSLSPLSL
jgi:hypothetical protein